MVANENNYGVEHVTVGPGLGGEETALGVWLGTLDSETAGLGLTEQVALISVSHRVCRHSIRVIALGVRPNPVPATCGYKETVYI